MINDRLKSANLYKLYTTTATYTPSEDSIVEISSPTNILITIGASNTFQGQLQVFKNSGAGRVTLRAATNVTIDGLTGNASDIFLYSGASIELETTEINNTWISKKGLRIPVITNIDVADATDATSAVTLANANKAKLNELLTAMRTAGILLT